MQKYDYVIVGAGLFGAVFAHETTKLGKKCLVIEKRNHIGGNCYTERINGIDVHKYGPHIFHTSNEKVWKYIQQFGEFNSFINQPVAISDGKTYNLPFNMNMFSKVWGITKPEEAIEIIKKESSEYQHLNPKNLEEQALKLVGKTIYELFIKGYTEKQWGKKCTELPPDIIKRLPVRFTYDNNYYDDLYQGIPKEGYTKLIENMLDGIEVRLNTSFHDWVLDCSTGRVSDKSEKLIYTGMIDELLDYKYGRLEYRSLKFVEIEKETTNYQGSAVINYPSLDVPYTRSIEHRHFNKDTVSDKTILSYEFSVDYKEGMIPYYPIGNQKNRKLHEKYLKLVKADNIYPAGRLGDYKYYDMDDTIENALQLVNTLNRVRVE